MPSKTSTENPGARLLQRLGPRLNNQLAVGHELNRLRGELDRAEFGAFMTKTMPTLGITKTRAYDRMKLAIALPKWFPNAAVRQQLMRLPTANGILSTKDGTVAPTPAVQKALREMRPLPRNAGPLQAEKWLKKLLQTARTIRTNGRTNDGIPSQVRTLFMRLVKSKGPRSAERLLVDLEKLLRSQSKSQD